MIWLALTCEGFENKVRDRFFICVYKTLNINPKVRLWPIIHQQQTQSIPAGYQISIVLESTDTNQCSAVVLDWNTKPKAFSFIVDIELRGQAGEEQAIVLVKTNHRL